MVNLRGNSTGRGRGPRNYLARREQWRLLLMVGSLGLVIVLMSLAANPANWSWLFSLDSGRRLVDARAEQEPIDTRLRPTSEESLPLDVFVAPAPREGEIETGGEYFPEVNQRYLSQVEDNTLLRRDEYDTLFHLLDILNRHEQQELEKFSLGEVGFAPMFKQPDTYRGKLVTVEGVIRRAFDMTPPANDFGLDRYYQLWLQPANGPRSPIVINVLELPEGFPTSRGPNGEVIEIYEEATITGFFYRNWAYTTQDQILTAPWILAKQIDWQPAPPPERREVQPLQIWLAFGGAAVIGIGFAVWVFASSNSKTVPSAADLAKRYHLESVASLSEQPIDEYDPAETLRQLAEESPSEDDTADPKDEPKHD